LPRSIAAGSCWKIVLSFITNRKGRGGDAHLIPALKDEPARLTVVKQEIFSLSVIPLAW